MTLVVFRSYVRPGCADEFNALADELMPIAESMPGFRSYKVFLAEDGERCSLIEFETPEQLQAWRRQLDHARAQQVGRERYYESYTLQVAEPSRESRFTREDGAE
jgi:heme-degrading monooxygenase HmoA